MRANANITPLRIATSSHEETELHAGADPGASGMDHRERHREGHHGAQHAQHAQLRGGPPDDSRLGRAAAALLQAARTSVATRILRYRMTLFGS